MTKTRRIAWGVAVIVAVVVVALVVTVLVGRHNESNEASASGTTDSSKYNTSLDDVVIGDGATSKSKNDPAVGVEFPTTCIGAAQAAGEWASTVFGVDQASAKVSPSAFSALVLNEIMSKDAVIRDDDPVSLAAATADDVTAAKENKQPLPTDDAQFNEGGFKLQSCTAGTEATITVIGNVLTNHWSWDSDTNTSSTAAGKNEDIRAYSFQLVARDGYWRVQQVVDAHDTLASMTTFGAAWTKSSGQMTSDVRDALKSDMGAGGHLYEEGE